MPALTVPKTPISLGPGYLYYGPLGTALPANTVVGSVFTDTWATAGAWVPWGITRDGSDFQYTVNTDIVEAAEYYDPLVIVTTGRAAQVAFEMLLMTATGMAHALNMAAASATSGAGTTLLTTVTPPAIGAEVRQMFGWESTSNDERLVMEQTFNAGTLAIGRKKGNANAGITVELHAELPASGFPFKYFTAGAARG